MTKHHTKKITAFMAATITAVFVFISAQSVFAWGPERTTYTNENPAPYATFNSITNNVAVGDERNFVRVREAGTSDTYTDEVEVVPGKEYEVYIYYHNDAASNTNETGFGIATDARVASAYPKVLNTDARGKISGLVYWSYVTPSSPNNAETGKIWDEAYLTTQYDGTMLKYKAGTATIHNAGAANGSVLPDALFTVNGTPIGFNKLAGTIPGCAEYSGYITYILVAESESITSELTKEISTNGTDWSSNVTVDPGTDVTYRVTFKNTGNTTLTDVIFTDTHDENLAIIEGSAKVYSDNSTDGLQIADVLDSSGYNAGNIAPGAQVQIIYQAHVSDDISDCTKPLSNKMSVVYNQTSQQESSTKVAIICSEIIEDCTTNPNLPGCTTPEDCTTNPNLPGCTTPSTLPNTGPLEITLAVIVILGIAGGGFYLWRTRHVLKTVENEVSGKNTEQPKEEAKTPEQNTPEQKIEKSAKKDQEDTPSQKS